MSELAPRVYSFSTKYLFLLYLKITCLPQSAALLRDLWLQTTLKLADERQKAHRFVGSNSEIFYHVMVIFPSIIPICYDLLIKVAYVQPEATVLR